MGALDERVRFAIEHARLMTVRYNGRLRVVEPHDYGVKNGSVKLLVYQLFEPGPGSARSDSQQGWKLLDVAKIESCDVQATTFSGSRGRSHQTHHTWQQVFARVK